MSPVMEVLDGRPTPTSDGAHSPQGPSLPHLDLGGLSPPRAQPSDECTPDRVSPARTPPTLPTSQQESPVPALNGEVDSLPPEPPSGYANPQSPDPHHGPQLEEEGPSVVEGTPPEYNTQAPCQLNTSSPTVGEDGDERVMDNETREELMLNGKGVDGEDHINALPLHPRGEVSEESLTPQADTNSYSLHQSSGVEDGASPQVTEGELEFARSHSPLNPEPPSDNVTNLVGDLAESNSQLSSDDLHHHRSMMEEHSHHHSLHQGPHHHLDDPHNPMEELHHLQSQHQGYNDQHPCHMQQEYQHPLLKLPLHLQEHMRDQQGHVQHDFEEHSHPLGDQRHLHSHMGEHPHHQHQPPSERSHEGYWNMHLGMLSKVKSEAKEWYERDDLVSDPLGGSGLIKSSEQLEPYNYRIPSHPSLGSESPLSTHRPSPIPHGGLPFSQSPDHRQHQPPPQHQQHYQPYQNHSGLRDMSPNYQGHPARGHLQGSQHHGASHIPGPQLHGGSHPGLQHPAQHHPGNQHLQYGQQFGGQQGLNLQGHQGQQLPSPYAQGLIGPGMGGPGGHRGHEGREGDPYSFVDEYTGPPPRPVDEVLGHAQPKRRGRKPKHIKLMENGGDPLAIAAAQAAHEAKKRKWRQMGPDGKPLPLPVKPRKRIDRFDGISEDELSKKILPDHLGPNLDIVIISKFPFQIGINPGLFAAYKGHHYAGPGNHFWKCLYLSGLIPEPLTSEDDHQLLEHGIGFTNIVARTTRGSAELTRKEIKEGGQILLAKLQRFQPRVAVFNGKGIYEIFSGKKEFTFGRQPEKIEGTHTHVWVMPSSSARCAQLPRALDKVPFYTALRKFRDFLKGTIAELTEEEITFSCPKGNIKHLKEEDKLEGAFEDDITESFLDDSLKDDLDSSRFESDLDTEEISRSISQSLYNLSGMTREQLEVLDCPTIPIRKKRGRPKKAPDDPSGPPRPRPRAFPTELLICNGEEPPRKKRGRPKKVLEDGSIAPPKRPGRKPKALKEVLATQQGNIPGPGMHSQMGMGPINGMMSPSGYGNNPGGPPFSPQFGNPQVHHMNGPTHPGDLMPHVHGVGGSNPAHGLNNHSGLSGVPHGSMHGGSMHSGPGLPSIHPGGGLHPQGCPTPGSSGSLTPAHNSIPTRGPTPQGFGQSPGYSSSPVPNSMHPLGSYTHHLDKNELQLEEERQLGLSPLPMSPVMAQPDFEPPASLPEGEPPLLAQAEDALLLDRQRQHTPSVPPQFSNPSTPADDSAPSYQGYTSYPPTSSPTYNSNVAPSPSFPPRVSHSPSYPTSVSCSPSYTPHNTHSPSYQSPSYPPTSTQSPSYPRNSTQSPNYPPPNPSRSPSYPPPPPPNQSPSFPPVTHSPSYPSSTTHSPSYHSGISHSPSYSSLTRSPSYPANLTHSPSYPPNSTHSPSYRPPTSQSPSFAPTLSPSLNKPLAPGVHSPQMKSDVSSKSLSGLESLVDQIPSLSETDAGPLPNGPCSNPTTPGPPTDPFSPGNVPQSSSSFQSFSGGSTTFPPSHYGSPQPAYSPQLSSSSTNMSTNFSVSSLANSSLTTSSHPFDARSESRLEGGAVCTSVASSASGPAPTSAPASSSSSFSVSSLTGGSPTPTPSMYSNSAYSPAAQGPSPQSYDIMGSSILPPTSPMGASFMGASPMGGSMGAIPSSMNMSYPYPQYGEGGHAGYSTAGHSFPYSSSSPGFHVPSPRFPPYPSPYPGGPYSQGYSQNAMLEHIKQTGMGMRFGGF